MRYQKIAIGIAVTLLIVLGFMFRDKIFRAGPKTSPENTQANTNATPQVPLPLAMPAEEQEAQGATSSPVQGTSPKGASLPAYQGRPLDEVRFSPEALQPASAQQKSQLSADIKKYATIVKETPEYIAAWLQLALLKNTIGDYEGSRDIWVYVTLARPREATAFLNLGNLYTNNLKNYPKAEANYRGAMKADPKVVMGYLGLSDLYVYFYQEKELQADQVLLQGIAANPKDVNLHKALARLYERRQNYAAALGEWQKVLALDPGNAGVKEKIEELKGK